MNETKRRWSWLVVLGVVLAGAIAATVVAFDVGGEDDRVAVRVNPGQSGDSVPPAPSTTGATVPPPTTQVTTPPTTAAAQPTDTGPLSTSSLLTFDGLGPIKLGMTVDEANRAGGVELIDIDKNGICLYPSEWEAKGLGNIGFAVTDGRVSRIVVKNPAIATLAGLRVGSPRAQAFSAYPGSTAVPRPSDTLVEDVWIDDGKGGRLYIAVTTGVKTQYPTGLPDQPSVLAMEVGPKAGREQCI